MRRIVPLAAFLILAGGGAWFALRGAGREPSTSDPASREGAAASPPAALPESDVAPDTRLAPAPGVGTSPANVATPAQPPPGAVEAQAIPDDPIEEGPATLALTVLDDETGAPQTGTVNLWRLDAPGNAGWLEGDQRQGNVLIAAGHGELGDLPEGRYRAVFEEQRGVVDDPAWFEVRAPRTEVTLRVPMPRRFPGSLRLLDERGVPLQEAEVQSSGRGYTMLPSRPAWVRVRELRNPSGQGLFLGSGGGGGSFSSRGWRRVVAVNDVLPVGEFLESSRRRTERVWLRVRTAGRNDVNVTLGDGASGPTTHLAVALPLATLLDRLVLPDGMPVLGSAAVTCEAELLTPETPPDRWRTLPVRVVVQFPDYQPLVVTADADHPSPLTPPWVRTPEKPAETPR